jgi:transposase-like protein
MSLARLVVTAVELEGRTKAEVARDYGVSRRWVYELCRRFAAGGEAGFEPRSRRPSASPGRTPEALEDEIVGLRKELSDQGLDAGAHTIVVHLARRHGQAQVSDSGKGFRLVLLRSEAERGLYFVTAIAGAAWRERPLLP